MGVEDARFLPAWERGGGVNPSLIWPCLALFTPNGEAGNEATVASFVATLTLAQRKPLRNCA